MEIHFFLWDCSPKLSSYYFHFSVPCLDDGWTWWLLIFDRQIFRSVLLVCGISVCAYERHKCSFLIYSVCLERLPRSYSDTVQRVFFCSVGQRIVAHKLSPKSMLNTVYLCRCNCPCCVTIWVMFWVLPWSHLRILIGEKWLSWVMTINHCAPSWCFFLYVMFLVV